MPMNHLLSQINSCEAQIGLSDDAIIHKAMQEWLEFVEAVVQSDQEWIISEARDAIANLLSAYHRVTGAGEMSMLSPDFTSSAVELAISLGQRNDVMQKYRGIYSRTTASLDDLTMHTESAVAQILGLTEQHTGQTMDVETVLAEQLGKFSDRLETYQPAIDLHDYISDVPDFPKEWILFKDISPLLHNPAALRHAVQQLASKAKDADVIVGLDARWFIFGTAVAQQLHKPFVMVRKRGKLPGAVIEESYDLEYGSNTQAIQIDSITSGQKVAIIDDLLATGGTAAAACKLVEKLGGEVQWCHFVIGLHGIGGQETLADYPVSELIRYDI